LTKKDRHVVQYQGIGNVIADIHKYADVGSRAWNEGKTKPIKKELFAPKKPVPALKKPVPTFGGKPVVPATSTVSATTSSFIGKPIQVPVTPIQIPATTPVHFPAVTPIKVPTPIPIQVPQIPPIQVPPPTPIQVPAIIPIQVPVTPIQVPAPQIPATTPIQPISAPTPIQVLGRPSQFQAQSVPSISVQIPLPRTSYTIPPTESPTNFPTEQASDPNLQVPPHVTLVQRPSVHLIAVPTQVPPKNNSKPPPTNVPKIKQENTSDPKSGATSAKKKKANPKLESPAPTMTTVSSSATKSEKLAEILWKTTHHSPQSVEIKQAYDDFYKVVRKKKMKTKKKNVKM
jgi:hypothetical protein